MKDEWHDRVKATKIKWERKREKMCGCQSKMNKQAVSHDTFLNDGRDRKLCLFISFIFLEANTDAHTHTQGILEEKEKLSS